MANKVFLDTNGWLALLNATESLHREADRIWRDLGRTDYGVVLTDCIVAETGNGLARSRVRSRFLEAVELIDRSLATEIVYVDEALFRRALEMYGQYEDKSWGLVDCASFVVMADAKINEAFTSDRHFEQSGFECLLPVA